MRGVAPPKRALFTLLAGLVGTVPWLVTAGWIHWILRCIDGIEQEIRPLSGLAYATFVQLADGWSSGAGWEQTVHRGYAGDWRWGGHYTPLLFASAWLSGHSDSPWALARVQAIAVGLGCLVAWKLGRDEAGRPGGLAGLALYAGSAPVALLALADYQDMVLILPILPLAVWAARHASALGFVLSAALLGAVREEALLLLPLVGLAGGLPRMMLGAGVLAAYLGFYQSLGPSPYPNPLRDILTFQAGQARAIGPAALQSLAPNLYGAMAGAGWPWLLAAPIVALPAAAAALFHAQDPTGVASLQSPAIHHLAPLTAAAITAGIVGAARLMRFGHVATVIVLMAVLGATANTWNAWQSPLRQYGLRVRGTGTHPAWALLDQVDSSEALLVPAAVAPAAARRRRVVTLDSLGDRVPLSAVRYALDDGQLQGTVVGESGGWRILKDPVLSIAPRNERTGGRQ